MQKNQIIIATVSVLVIFGFLFGAYALTNQPEKKVVYAEAKTLKPDDHLSWSPNKKQILTEYSDLQCPACKAFHDSITQIEKSKDGAQIMKNVTFVFRHYPLTTVHEHALSAAYAAQAASKQGKFEEFKNLLFDKQTEWEKSKNAEEQFVKYAQSLGLDTAQFAKDASSKEVQDRVQADILSGNQVGVDATPTFFLNGVKLSPNSLDEFKALLLDAANQK